MHHPTAEFPFFILQLNFRGEILRNLHCNSQNIFPGNKICRDFIALVDNGSVHKAKQFFNDILALGAVMEWELSFHLNGKTEVFSTSGFKAQDFIYVIVSGKANGAQMMYEELSLINNEQLNSIRILRKQLNLMAAEYTQIRAQLHAENEALRKELEALRVLTK